jgi:hypothetical protein
MKRSNITHTALALAVAGALGTAALAAEPSKKAAAPAAQATAPVYEHVKVVNATPELLAQIAAERQSKAAGMRAYVDGNGQLRAATAEDLAAEAATPQARTALARSAAPQARGAAVSTVPTRASLSGSTAKARSAGVGVGVQLDDSTMAYSVATIGPDGKLKEDCVTGQPNGPAALKAAVTASGVNVDEK